MAAVAILDFWYKEDICDIDLYIIKIFEPKHSNRLKSSSYVPRKLRYNLYI